MKTADIFISAVIATLVLLGLGLFSQQVWVETPDLAPGSPAQTVAVVGCISTDRIQPIFDEFTSSTGITVQYEDNCDLDRIRYCEDTEDCPDVAIMPQPGLMADLALDGSLVDLSTFIDSMVLSANYSDTWIDMGKVGSTLYGVWFNASNKSLVWFDPVEFNAHAWSSPSTWTEMMTLSELIVNTTSTPPWSIGNQSGVATGWPLTDWFENILLRSAGPDIYDELVAHNIPWTHAEVVTAITYFGEILGNEDYQLGGKHGTLNTYFVDAMYPPFEAPPQAYMHLQGSFANAFIQDHFPAQTAGADFAIFPFPDIDAMYTNAVMGAGDYAMMFHNTSEAQSLINFLITTQAAELWITQGGNLSPNRSVDFNLYSDWNMVDAAYLLANADIFRFDLTDQLPSDLNLYVWSQMGDLVQAAPDPEAMEQVLARIEYKASHPYGPYLPLIVHE